MSIQPIKLNSRRALIDLDSNQVTEIPENAALTIDSKSQDILGAVFEGKNVELNWRVKLNSDFIQSDYRKTETIPIIKYDYPYQR